MQVLVRACEPPEKSGRPLTRWTGHESADETEQRVIVASIGATVVNRYLHEARRQPHRSHYWLNAKEEAPQQFQEKARRLASDRHGLVVKFTLE